MFEEMVYKFPTSLVSYFDKLPELAAIELCCCKNK